MDEEIEAYNKLEKKLMEQDKRVVEFLRFAKYIARYLEKEG